MKLSPISFSFQSKLNVQNKNLKNTQIIAQNPIKDTVSFTSQIHPAQHFIDNLVQNGISKEAASKFFSDYSNFEKMTLLTTKLNPTEEEIEDDDMVCYGDKDIHISDFLDLQWQMGGVLTPIQAMAFINYDFDEIYEKLFYYNCDEIMDFGEIFNEMEVDENGLSKFNAPENILYAKIFNADIERLKKETEVFDTKIDIDNLRDYMESINDDFFEGYRLYSEQNKNANKSQKLEAAYNYSQNAFILEDDFETFKQEYPNYLFEYVSDEDIKQLKIAMEHKALRKQIVELCDDISKAQEIIDYYELNELLYLSEYEELDKEKVNRIYRTIQLMSEPTDEDRKLGKYRALTLDEANAMIDEKCLDAQVCKFLTCKDSQGLSNEESAEIASFYTTWTDGGRKPFDLLEADPSVSEAHSDTQILDLFGKNFQNLLKEELPDTASY